jgi:hypothetical protein
MATLKTNWIAPLMLAVMAFAALAPSGHAQAQTGQRCFSETGQCMSGRIREFWEKNGGLPVFGYPTGPQQEVQLEGMPFQAQQFERNRLELHPENVRPYDMLLGRLGADRLAQQGRDPFTFPKSQGQAGCRFFTETQHNVCGDILKAWRASGLEFDGKKGKSEAENLALFGLPLSDTMTETLSDGKTYTVQWFERARFELHPENQPPYHVLLGLLGNEARDGAKPAPQPTPAPVVDQCADVPEPMSARIRTPGKCIKQGTSLEMDIFGFQPNEKVGFWLNAPDGSIVGIPQQIDIGPAGELHFPQIPVPRDLPLGVYSFVFQGTASGHVAIVYLKIVQA